MRELRSDVERLVMLAERIDERTERIDIRTEGHSTQLINLSGLKDETAKIARSLESLADRHARRMFFLACTGLIMLTVIILLLISAYTRTSVSIGKDEKGMHLSTGVR
jgi:hypothetical protein